VAEKDAMSNDWTQDNLSFDEVIRLIDEQLAEGEGEKKKIDIQPPWSLQGQTVITHQHITQGRMNHGQEWYRCLGSNDFY
jgi:hypothetical protein